LARTSNRAALPLSVIALGLVSLLTDASSEMIFPLLPAFLAARVADAPLLIGAMEGLADCVAALTKWWSGRWADRSRRLKPMVLAGYGLATLMRPWMAFVTRGWEVLFIRSVDRIGKGLRGSPRDAMIAAWVPPGGRGRAFGFHRAMDNGGAALGALIASGLVAVGISIGHVFLLSAVPGTLSVLAVFLAREPQREAPARQERPLAPLPSRLAHYLVPVTLFGIANSTDAFILLRLSEQGARPALLPLAWLMLNGVKALASFPGGWLADRLGTSRVVLAGWVLYALSYAGLAWVRSVPATMGVMAFYGLYHALSEGGERALLADLSPAESRGRAFGLYSALAGVSSLAGGLLFGFIWTHRSSAAAFVTAGAIAGGSAVLLGVLLPRARAVPAAA
jgi:MFS family permease